MRTNQQFSITLPTEMASLVKSKVASGDYATESEVIRDGLRVLMARDRAMEQWLQTQVGPAYDALKADPPRALPIAEVRQRIAAVHGSATSKT
ncbi:MAG: type II toxin-antitoxin system ParD family antitoxin [Rhodoferax sp.]|nr:type II toxin-antitoxin system ParD family antitoxin [Rhodoferax sp.]